VTPEHSADKDEALTSTLIAAGNFLGGRSVGSVLAQEGCALAAWAARAADQTS